VLLARRLCDWTRREAQFRNVSDDPSLDVADDGDGLRRQLTMRLIGLTYSLTDNLRCTVLHSDALPQVEA
jgi:hypothetical protein